MPLTLGLSAHLDTRLALAFPLGLSSKVTSSERPPRTAASKPAPLSPHPFFDVYFFPAPGLLVLACLCLAGPRASFSTPQAAGAQGCVCPALAPLPGAFVGGGCPHGSSGWTESLHALGRTRHPRSSNHTRKAESGTALTPRGILRGSGCPSRLYTWPRRPRGPGEAGAPAPQTRLPSRCSGDGSSKAAQHTRRRGRSTAPCCNCSLPLSPLADVPSACSAHH